MLKKLIKLVIYHKEWINLWQNYLQLFIMKIRINFNGVILERKCK